MKYFADKKRREVEYQVGDMVLVKLRPHRQVSILGQTGAYSKLNKRFYGPFRVIERIGSTAYKLQLPEEARIHPVFHCSLLKSYHSTEMDTSPHPSTLPILSNDDHLLIQPLTFLNTRRNKDSALEVLVQWQGLSPDDTTWENWDQLRADYHLEDKVLPEAVRNDSNLETRPKRRIRAPTYLKDFTSR